MQANSKELNDAVKNLRKGYLKAYALALLIINISYLLLYAYLGLTNLNAVFIPVIILCISSYYFINRYAVNFIFIVEASAYLATIVVFLLAVFFWEKMPVVFLWFLTIPVALQIIKPFRTILTWSIALLLLAAAAPLVNKWLAAYIDFSYSFSTQSIVLINYSVFVACLGLILLSLYYIAEFNKLKSQQVDFINASRKDKFMLNEHTDGLIESVSEEKDIVDNARELELLAKIKQHFKQSKSYKTPSYSIQDLAKELNSNTSYISRAINKHNDGLSFKQFMNSYRIAEIKQRLDKKEYEQFTLQTIYTEAGFEHQSTFNRVFKEQVGVTPTAYVKSVNKN